MTHGQYQPGPAGEATAHRDRDRWTLHMVREWNHPPDTVWSTLTDPTRLREWAPFDAARNLETPGPVLLTMAGSTSVDPTDCTVTRAVRPRALEYTWGSDLLRWDLELTRTGTRVTLHHTVKDRGWLSTIAAGWHICLDVAERTLDGHSPGRIVGNAAKEVGWERLNAEYTDKFSGSLERRDDAGSTE